MKPVSIKEVTLFPSFLSERMTMVADQMIPYQWLALNDEIPDADPSYCVRNLRSAAGEIKAPHGGNVYQDSDLAKWIEAACYMLMWKTDKQVENHIDYLVNLMEKAQLADGYLNTYYLLTDINLRFTNLKDNSELYCAGHLLEAAVAYYEATGKRNFLDIMIKYVDLIDNTFGSDECKIKGYPGHEEIELALVKLYTITHNEKHLRLAKYFIDQRGSGSSFFEKEARLRGDTSPWGESLYTNDYHYQAGEPVREQKKAYGHAVRQLYLLCGMADVARETKDEDLISACETLWKDITHKQMYITGAVGQTAFGESFTFDYDLPNDTVYGETCAAIALFFFAQRMLRLKPLGEYADICDTVLYNGAISGVNIKGDSFFYVNPLESVPERSKNNRTFSHIKTERQKWFGCACCPPNLARLLTGLPGYIFTKDKNTLFMNLYTSCEINTVLDDGEISFKCSTDYPWIGDIKITVIKCFKNARIALRCPRWAKKFELKLNGDCVDAKTDNGYLYLDSLKTGDELLLTFDMPVQLVHSNPRVISNSGLVAVCKGPVVYCLEEDDNGRLLSNVRIEESSDYLIDSFEIDGITIPRIAMTAKRLSVRNWDENELYASDHETIYEDITAYFIPYFAWNNRSVGEMRVWLHMLNE